MTLESPGQPTESLAWTSLVPVVEQGGREQRTSFQCSFVALTRSNDSRVLVAALIGFHHMVPIAWLRWMAGEDGEILDVYVAAEYRRRGLATVLLEVATGLAEEQGWSKPEHSGQRTSSGEAWALAHGAGPATQLISDEEWESDPARGVGP